MLHGPRFDVRANGRVVGLGHTSRPAFSGYCIATIRLDFGPETEIYLHDVTCRMFRPKRFPELWHSGA